MADAIVTLLALAAVPLLLRRSFGGGSARPVVRVRWRVPLWHRHPRLWWASMTFGALLVGLAWLVDSCGGAG